MRGAKIVHLSTKGHICLAAILWFVGVACDAITEPLWTHYGLHAVALEYLGGGLAWSGYVYLWILLCVAPFRPTNRFSLVGECATRAKLTATVFVVLMIVHAMIISSYSFLGHYGA